MSTAENPNRKSPGESLKSTARGQLSMILVQFLAGIAVNLIGMPSKTNGFPKIGTSILLGLHVLLAIGLLVGAIRAIRPASQIEPGRSGIAWVGLVAVAVAFAAGVLTMATNSNWWSYLMAVGATATLVIYGLLYVYAGK